VKILIETRTPSPSGGRAAIARKTVTAHWVRVGRNASCELHLPDPRIALEQGMIADRDGLVYIEGESGSQNITRKAVRSTRLKPGQPIEVGPYRIVALEPPEGYDAAICVERLRPPEVAPDLRSRTSHLTLASLGLPKRGAAWALAVTILVLGFAVPAGRVLHLPWSLVATSPVGDRMWNPGPLILAHQVIEPNCAACHEIAFRHVRDAACLHCHRTIGQHVGPALHPAALFKGARCASCHRDHKGVAGAWRDDDRFCVDCHRDLRARVPGATVENVADFASAHAAFRITIVEGSATKRVRQGEGPIMQRSALIFRHDKHLDPRGVRSPGKGRVRLDCGACHHPDASKRGFEPISMARDCQDCHRLQFEPAVTTREVPHGKPADAVTVVEEFYANLALNGTRDSFEKAFGVPGEGLLRRVGAPDDAQRQGALELARRKADRVARDLFEVRVCKTCHAVRRVGAGTPPAWDIERVRTTQRWMPQAKFDHRAHASSRCAECHDVRGSKSADEVAMPTIDTCRRCHGGSVPVARKITSNCLLCHGFHDAAHPWNGAAPERTALAR